MGKNRWKYLAVLISTMFLAVFSFSGCSAEKNKEESTTENVVENDLKKENETQKSEGDNSNSSNNSQKSTGFSTEYTIEDAKDGYFVVSKLDGALFGLLDSFGKETLPLEYDYISFPDSEKAHAVIVEKEGKMGILDYSGNTILPIEYDSINKPGVRSTLYLVEKEGVQSIVNLDGTVYKELTGKYDDLIADNFLVIGGGPAYSEVYGLDEQTLFSGNINEPGGKYAYNLDTVKGYLGICDFGSSSMSLMDSEGNMVMNFPFAQKGETYGMLEDIGLDNLARIQYASNGSLAVPRYKLINIAQNSISDKDYNQIIGNGESAFALSINSDTNTSSMDVYDLDGQIKEAVDFDSDLVEIEMENSLIRVKKGETCRLYDSDGKEVSEGRYLNAEPIHSFWMVQNLDGEYGLMDSVGEMRINFGEMGEERYQGKEWEDTYVFDDTFCIVIENGEGCNVYLF